MCDTVCDISNGYNPSHPGRCWSVNCSVGRSCASLNTLQRLLIYTLYSFKASERIWVSCCVVQLNQSITPLTVICHVRSQKVSLLAIREAAQPPVVIVLEQHSDDVAAVQREFVQPGGCVVVQSHHLGGGAQGCRFEWGLGRGLNSTAGVRTYQLLRTGACVSISPYRQVVGEALEKTTVTLAKKKKVNSVFF